MRSSSTLPTVASSHRSRAAKTRKPSSNCWSWSATTPLPATCSAWRTSRSRSRRRSLLRLTLARSHEAIKSAAPQRFGPPHSFLLMRILVAGATGVLGRATLPHLARHEVVGLTRSREKLESLRDLGAEPVLCDVYDYETLQWVTQQVGPQIIVNFLTDLSSGSAEANNRVRREGGGNLLKAARITARGPVRRRERRVRARRRRGTGCRAARAGNA